MLEEIKADGGDVSKYVHPGYSGDIVNVGDVDSLKARIMELIVNKKKREIKINIRYKPRQFTPIMAAKKNSTLLWFSW